VPLSLESILASNEAVGLGQPVKKLIDKKTGQTLAYVGILDGQEHVYFPKPLALRTIASITERIEREKNLPDS
jgi:hypothetical protein